MHPGEKSQRVRKLFVIAVFFAALLSGATLAVNLPPGGAAPLSGVSGGAGPGTVILDDAVPFQVLSNGGALLFEGELRDRVVRLNATGTLAFVRQILNTTPRLNGRVVRLECGDYRSFLTNVDFSTTSLGTVRPDSASRTSNGSNISFHFDETPITGGDESKFVHVATEALHYADRGKCIVRLATGEETSVSVVRPVRHVDPGCREIDFEDLPPGMMIPAGGSFASNGVLMHLREFYWDVGSCTNPTMGGAVRVQSTDMACGSGRELQVGNVNVEFDYGAPLLGMVIYFGEYGGNVNLTVNGHCVSVPDFSDLPPVVGGVEVTVNEANPGQGCGRITLQGPIHSVSVGGQEFWIDQVLCEPDVCFDDNTPPVAEIGEPGSESCVCDPVAIHGTANDVNFDRYLLEYRLTTDPIWHPIVTSGMPVVAGLLGTWSAAGLPQGRYIIRLTAVDACGHSSTAVTVVWLGTTFDSLILRGPDNGDILGGTVCLDGTVWDNYCFDEYAVEYRPAGGTLWSPVDPSQPIYTSTVINDPFAQWDTVGLGIPDGQYALRVRARDDCDNTAEVTRDVIVDNTWPTAVITDPQPCQYVEGFVEVRGTAADANLDSWVLQYSGGAASGWVNIASGNTPVVGGVLGMWDTTALRPCAYMLRLVVVDRAVLNCNGAIRHRSEYTVSVNVGTCGDFDVDDDGDVDLFDYQWFERAFTGPLP